MTELIQESTLAEYEAFVQSHPKGHFAQSSLWAKQKPAWKWRAIVSRGADGRIRGSIAFLHAAQAHAAMQGRDYVLPDDVKAVCPDVLAHRLICKGHGALQSSGQAKEILAQILSQTRAPIEG